MVTLDLDDELTRIDDTTWAIVHDGDPVRDPRFIERLQRVYVRHPT